MGAYDADGAEANQVEAPPRRPRPGVASETGAAWTASARVPLEGKVPMQETFMPRQIASAGSVKMVNPRTVWLDFFC